MILSELLEQVQDCTQAHQPGLSISTDGSQIILQGDFAVKVSGIIEDSYDVRIEVNPGFPAVQPRVYERAGRIPRTANRHMFPSTEGQCCLGVWVEWLGTGSRSFERFLCETVHDYFFGQYYYEMHPNLDEASRWPLGQRSHGAQGILEGCARVLGVPANEESVYAALSFVLGREIDRNANCPCGSGRRFKRCHRSRLWQCKQTIREDTINEMLAELKLYEELRT